MYGNEVVALCKSMVVTFVEYIVPNVCVNWKYFTFAGLIVEIYRRTRVVEEGNREDNVIKMYRRILIDENRDSKMIKRNS